MNVSSCAGYRWFSGIPLIVEEPDQVMSEVKRAIQALRWKCKSSPQGPFLLKVMVPARSPPSGSVGVEPRPVRMRLQLYKISGGLQLDVQNYDGEVFHFLQACDDLFREMHL